MSTKKAEWRTMRAVVEIRVRGDLSETQFRWCVETALTSSRPLETVMRGRCGGLWLHTGRLAVRMWSRVLARIPVKTETVVREQRMSYMG